MSVRGAGVLPPAGLSVKLMPSSVVGVPTPVVSPQQAECRGLLPHGLQCHHALPSAQGTDWPVSFPSSLVTQTHAHTLFMSW